MERLVVCIFPSGLVCFQHLQVAILTGSHLGMLLVHEDNILTHLQAQNIK